MQDEVKKDIINGLDVVMDYFTASNKKVSLVQCMSNKGGITVVHNEKNELVLTRLVMRWRGYIDYHKMNTWMQKDHFYMSFIDQKLDHLVGRGWYCFLASYQGIIRFVSPLKTKRKTLSHVHMVHSPSRGCVSDFVILPPLFRIVQCPYFLIWQGIIQRSLWIISRLQVTLLMTVYPTWISLFRDVISVTWC